MLRGVQSMKTLLLKVAAASPFSKEKHNLLPKINVIYLIFELIAQFEYHECY